MSRAPSRLRQDLVYFFAATLLISWGLLAVPITTGKGGGPWVALGTSGPTLAALLLWILGRRRRPSV